MLKMDIEYNRNILFVRLKGILDKKSSYKINNYINPVIKKHNIKCLVYNLDDLDGIDTSGVAAITASKYIIKCNRGVIYTCGKKERLNGLSKLVKLKRIEEEWDAFKITEMIK